MEAACLGLFMVSAGLFATLLEYPGSPVHAAIPEPLARRGLMGLAMGLTAVGIIYSPWGQQSGAHMNPAFTLTFFRLGKMEPADAAFYVLAQFAGGCAGVYLVLAMLGDPFALAPVRFVVTAPGIRGIAVAFLAEAVIAFGMMTMVLVTSNHRRTERLTGLFAGLLVWLYITIEAPLSGMSMNPARSFASAFPARLWTALWIYFTAPVAGMLLAAEVNRLLKWAPRIYCAKLNHHNDKRCIFRCRYGELVGAAEAAAPAPAAPAAP